MRNPKVIDYVPAHSSPTAGAGGRFVRLLLVVGALLFAGGQLIPEANEAHYLIPFVGVLVLVFAIPFAALKWVFTGKVL